MLNHSGSVPQVPTILKISFLIIFFIFLIQVPVVSAVSYVQIDDIIYVYGSGSTTISAIDTAIGNVSALNETSTGMWLLNANLYVNSTDIALYINDTDVSWLKMNSTDSTYHYIRSDGSLEINNTKITSWNTTDETVVTYVHPSPRSFIFAHGMGASMNISNSNVSYLGYHEYVDFWSYGVSYRVGATGNVVNNTIINNRYGIYSYNPANYDTYHLFNNNYISDSKYGIYTPGSKKNNISCNTILNGDCGIYLSISGNQGNNTIVNNNITVVDGSGIHISGEVPDNIIANNNVTKTNAVSGTHAISICSTGNSIYNNWISSAGYALFIINDYNTLTDNTIASSSLGYWFSGAQHNRIVNGTVTGTYPYYFSGTSNNNTFSIPWFAGKTINVYLSSSELSKFDFNVNSSNIVMEHYASVSNARTTRGVNNWTQNNITFDETATATSTYYYDLTGLKPNSYYKIWNDSVNTHNLYTDASGALPQFSINLSTSTKCIQVLLYSIDINPPTNIQTTPSQTWINITWDAVPNADKYSVYELENGFPYVDTDPVMDGIKDAIYDYAHEFLIFSPNPVNLGDYGTIYPVRTSLGAYLLIECVDNDNKLGDDDTIYYFDLDNNGLTVDDPAWKITNNVVKKYMWGGASWQVTGVSNAVGASTNGSTHYPIHELFIPIAELGANWTNGSTVKVLVKREDSSLSPDVVTWYPYGNSNDTDTSLWQEMVLNDPESYILLGNTTNLWYNATGLTPFTIYHGAVSAWIGSVESNYTLFDAITKDIPTYTVSGTVSDSDGDPIADATVYSCNGFVHEITTTNVSGYWIGYNFREDNYTICASKAGYYDNSIDIFVDSNLTNQNITLSTVPVIVSKYHKIGEMLFAIPTILKLVFQKIADVIPIIVVLVFIMLIINVIGVAIHAIRVWR